MEQLHLFTPPKPSRRCNQRGAELVEFALLFPVLMLFVVAALSLLWTGFIKVAAAQAAKEAARYASVPVACSGDLGPQLADTNTSLTVPQTLPDGSPVPTVPDILKTINGFDMTSPEKALEAYAKLRTSPEITIGVNRGDKPLNIVFNIK